MTDCGVVVVGASVAGSRVASELRDAGHRGVITLVDPDPDAPYDRPPLSKQILAGEWDEERAALGDPAQWQAGRRVAAAIGLDPERRVLRLDDGFELAYDKLVLACGMAPIPLPGMPREGAHLLRTLQDCRRLRADLERVGSGGRLVVVGGGFIGAEVASTARSRGLDVTVVEAQEAPLSGLLGTEAATELALLHRDNDVRLLCGTPVVGLVGTPSVTGVTLADGRVLPADVVVVGVGVRPDTDWLEGSGVPLAADGGVLCDEYCAVDPDRTLYAVGDVARCHDPRREHYVRVEHWTDAVAQATVVAHDITGVDRAPHRPDYFVWSDQYGGKITLLGRPGPDDTCTLVRTEGPRRRFAAVYRHDGDLTAVLTVNWPKALVAARRAMADPAGAEDVVATLKNL